MLFHTTNFIRRFVKVTVAAICLATGLAAGQTAYAIDVTQTGNTLTITGDNSDDLVGILGEYGGLTDGGVQVWTTLGIESYDGVRDLNIDLQGGDNSLWMYDFEVLQSDVSFTAGDENDEVWMEQCRIFGSLTLDLGNGNNDVHLATFSAWDLSVNGGSGRDRVEMLSVDFNGITCVTRGGNDFVGLGAGYSTWDTGFGYNIELTVRTGSGRDLVALVGVVQWNWQGGTLIRMGRQDDILSMGSTFGEHSRFEADFEALGGRGEDTLYRFPENIYDHPPTFQGFEEVH